MKGLDNDTNVETIVLLSKLDSKNILVLNFRWMIWT